MDRKTILHDMERDLTEKNETRQGDLEDITKVLRSKLHQILMQRSV